MSHYPYFNNLFLSTQVTTAIVVHRLQQCLMRLQQCLMVPLHIILLLLMTREILNHVVSFPIPHFLLSLQIIILLLLFFLISTSIRTQTPLKSRIIMVNCVFFCFVMLLLSNFIILYLIFLFLITLFLLYHCNNSMLFCGI